jgi:hypothetical protein
MINFIFKYLFETKIWFAINVLPTAKQEKIDDAEFQCKNKKQPVCDVELSKFSLIEILCALLNFT